MVAKLRKFLGLGLYTLSEAALYARVPVRMMQRWVFGSGAGEAVIDPEFGCNDRIVSFLDLVQTLAIREIRLQRRIPLPKFRQAIKVARDDFKLDYPFARAHCTYYDGAEIIIRPPRGGDQPGEDFVEASGKHRAQKLFPFVELYLTDLGFSKAGLANLYNIYRSPAQVLIKMDPELRFGEPLLPSGYTAMSIWESIRAEGSIERAASVNGIPVEEAQAAYKFFVDFLGKAAA